MQCCLAMNHHATFEYNAIRLLFQAFECEYDEVILNSITTNKDFLRSILERLVCVR